jgi:hypothetical protein
MTDVVIDLCPVSNIAMGRDAHWYATEGIAGAVVHAMLVQPAAADVTAALEDRDFPRAVGSAVDCLRWIAVCEAVLSGHTAGGTPLDVDLLIAGTDRAGGADDIRLLAVDGNATFEDAQEAAALAFAAETRLVASLPFRLPARRTPTGYQPSVDTVSELERLRHRLGLPDFDWEAWVG